MLINVQINYLPFVYFFSYLFMYLFILLHLISGLLYIGAMEMGGVEGMLVLQIIKCPRKCLAVFMH